MSDVFIPIIIVPTIMLVIGWIARTVSNNRRLRDTAKLQAEMQTKLLEKFGTSQDMLAFLASDAGRRFVESTTVERSNPHGRILGGVQAGVLLLLGGLGFFAADSTFGIDGQAFAHFLGIMGIALGAGFLTSSFVAMRLSRSWGLLKSAPLTERAAE
jgi:hypothetical protein